jgi:histidinol-phosphate/aromatic aminotransferase/cobyric acid decarboxylase-like protein
MNPFWSQIVCELSPYVPGEQPRIANLVKLNTNESPFGPSPLALDVMRAAAADSLRLYPDPEATELREALAAGGVIEVLIVWYRQTRGVHTRRRITESAIIMRKGS